MARHNGNDSDATDDDCVHDDTDDDNDKSDDDDDDVEVGDEEDQYSDNIISLTWKMRTESVFYNFVCKSDHKS